MEVKLSRCNFILSLCIILPSYPRESDRRMSWIIPSVCIRRRAKPASSGFAEVLIALSFWERMNLRTPWKAGFNQLSEKKGFPIYFTIMLYRRSWDFLLPSDPGEAGTFYFPTISQRTRYFLLPKSQLFKRTRDFLLPNYPREARTSYFPTIAEKQGLPTFQLSQRSRDFLVPS